MECEVRNDGPFLGKVLDEMVESSPKGLIPVFGLEDKDGLGRALP